jgi:hypothetical protein
MNNTFTQYAATINVDSLIKESKGIDTGIEIAKDNAKSRTERATICGAKLALVDNEETKGFLKTAKNKGQFSKGKTIVEYFNTNESLLIEGEENNYNVSIETFLSYLDNQENALPVALSSVYTSAKEKLSIQEKIVTEEEQKNQAIKAWQKENHVTNANLKGAVLANPKFLEEVAIPAGMVLVASKADAERTESLLKQKTDIIRMLAELPDSDLESVIQEVFALKGFDSASVNITDTDSVAA